MRGVNPDSRRVTRGRTPVPRQRRTQDATAVPPHATAVLRRLAVPAGVLTAVAGAFAYVGAVDPNQPGHYPVCPLLRYAGLYCPGCGGLRSAHAFVHGDFVTALHDNALAAVGYPVFAVVWTLWVLRAVRGRPPHLVLGTAHLWSLGALLLVFTVVRNLPFGGWLHP
ncbi:DUF2752 domain-containing protein [Streptomyces sp. NPDC088353]|uniref:DUF2752 domain-containing protein n=1 Tax=Streptomyces sp. NPDC088353 TaxID=3365855 RepID=UPI0038248A57